MIRFYITLTAVMAFLTSAVYAGVHYGWVDTMPSFAVPVVLVVGLSTGLIYFLLVRRAEQDTFTQAYLLSIVLKMLSFSVFILIVIFSDREGAFANALIFLVSYFVFTGVEVGFLYGRINSRKSPK
jgi:inner membrane protein involved in colicin E2 resistance